MTVEQFAEFVRRQLDALVAEHAGEEDLNLDDWVTLFTEQCMDTPEYWIENVVAS